MEETSQKYLKLCYIFEKDICWDTKRERPPNLCDSMSCGWSLSCLSTHHEGRQFGAGVIIAVVEPAPLAAVRAVRVHEADAVCLARGDLSNVGRSHGQISLRNIAGCCSYTLYGI